MNDDTKREIGNSSLRTGGGEYASQSPAAGSFPAEFDTARLLHELQMQKIELEMQNEELRKAHQELNAERSLLKNIINSTDVMLVHLDLQFNFVTVNSAYADTCRMKPEDMIGRNHFDLYPDPENEAIFRKVRDTGLSVFIKDRPFEFPDQPERGVTYWDWSLCPVNDEAGNLSGLVFSLRETTQFKLSDLELKNTSANLNATLNATTDGILAIDTAGKVDFYNKRFTELWNIPDAVLQTGNDTNLLNSVLGQLADPTVFLTEVQRLYCSDKNSFDTINFKDGKVFERYSFPLKVGEALPHGRVWSFRDITKRRKAENALHESETRYRDLVENISSGVAVFETRDNGEDFLYVDLNKAGELIEETWREDLIGRSVIEARPGIRENGLLDVFRRVWESGTPEFHPVTLYQDDRIARWHVNYVYQLPSGEIVSIFNDITGRKQAEEQIHRSLDEKVVLLKEIHHRVKNNLQVVQSLMNLQAMGTADSSICAMFLEARDRITSMALIHENLYQSDDLARVDFRNYLESLVRNVSDTYGRHDVRISVEMEPLAVDVNIGIPCGLIVNELVSNSLKYAFPEGRTGIITTGINKNSHGEYILSVADNGIGFPADLDFRSTKSLGMQLVTILARQIHGTIELTVVDGTVFSITFPVQKDERRGLKDER